MNDAIDISVVVCTYNRSESLGATVKSLAAQTLPESIGWEILIVDNNSTDETRQVVEDLQRRYPERIRYMFELKQGLSHARNAAIREARGEILAFIDDDETAAPSWLGGLTANLYTGEWAGAGGPVLPKWERPRPNWLAIDSPFTLGPLAAWKADPTVARLTNPPVGANMAYRKDLFERYGGFRTDLGRVGKILLHGEDTEFGRRLMAAGKKLRYEPSAITYHPAEENRLHKKYFLTWWFNKGRSDVREFGDETNKPKIAGVPLRLLRDVTVEVVRWMVAFSPAKRFVSILKIWDYAGEGYESHLSWLDARRNVHLRPPAENVQ